MLNTIDHLKDLLNDNEVLGKNEIKSLSKLYTEERDELKNKLVEAGLIAPASTMNSLIYPSNADCFGILSSFLFETYGIDNIIRKRIMLLSSCLYMTITPNRILNTDFTEIDNDIQLGSRLVTLLSIIQNNAQNVTRLCMNFRFTSNPAKIMLNCFYLGSDTHRYTAYTGIPSSHILKGNIPLNIDKDKLQLLLKADEILYGNSNNNILKTIQKIKELTPKEMGELITFESQELQKELLREPTIKIKGRNKSSPSKLKVRAAV